MDEKIDLKELLQLLRRRIVVIIVSTFVIFSLSGLAVFFFLGPYYQYSKQILVGPLEGDNSNSNVQIISSYIDFVKSPVVLKTVKNTLHLNQSIYDLASQITIDNRQNSQIVTIVVKDKDPKKVKQIANKLAQSSLDKMEKFIGKKNMHLLDDGDIGAPALILTTPVLSLLMSLFIGIFLGICLAILKEQFDDTIRKQSEIEDMLGVPFLGSIKLGQKGKSRKKE